MTTDAEIRRFARTILAGYRLDPSERAQELDLLTQQLQTALDIALENLEHRRIA